MHFFNINTNVFISDDSYSDDQHDVIQVNGFTLVDKTDEQKETFLIHLYM